MRTGRNRLARFDGFICCTICFTVVLLACFAPALFAQTETGFLSRTVPVEDTDYRYQVYVPPDWTPEKKWPVLLFLHGSVARGDDNQAQTNIGLGPVIRRDPARFPLIAVFPQARKGASWLQPGTEKMALAVLDAAMAEFHGDPARIYLTGQSLGGYGAWALAVRHPGKFAALVPICGGIRRFVQDDSLPGDRYEAAARRIGKTPVWIFHGENDRTVPVGAARRMHEVLQAQGGEVRYTEYKRMGHLIWDRAYAEPELIPWLLSHHATQR